MMELVGRYPDLTVDTCMAMALEEIRDMRCDAIMLLTCTRTCSA